MKKSIQTSPQVFYVDRIPRYITLAGPCYALSGVCDLTSSEASVVEKAVEHRSLVAVDTDPIGLLFPVWQFPQGRLLPHLAEVVTALPTAEIGTWDTALWFTRRRRVLRGNSAARWLRDGGDPETIRALAGPSDSFAQDLDTDTQHLTWLEHLHERGLVSSIELSTARGRANTRKYLRTGVDLTESAAVAI